MNANVQSIRSLGNALRFLGVSLPTFRKAQAELGVVPDHIDDDVEHFDDDDLQRIREHLASQRRVSGGACGPRVDKPHDRACNLAHFEPALRN